MSYRKGAKLEYVVKSKFEKEGYYVVRSAGSHGIADLVAIYPPLFYHLGNKVILVQCSVKPKSNSEINKLLSLCSRLRTVPCLAFKENHKIKILMGKEVTDYISKRLGNKCLNITRAD